MCLSCLSFLFSKQDVEEWVTLRKWSFGWWKNLLRTVHPISLVAKGSREIDASTACLRGQLLLTTQVGLTFHPPDTQSWPSCWKERSRCASFDCKQYRCLLTSAE